MSETIHTPIAKIEDSPLWRAVSKIARDSYNTYSALSDDHWNLRSKLEANAVDVTNDVAEACGSLDPRDVKWSLGHARKDLFSLKNAYSLAFHTGVIEPQPEVMVAIDDAVKLIDKEIASLGNAFKRWRDEMTLHDKAGHES
jgi:hypothetical protein